MEQTSAKREKRKSLLRIAIPIILSSCLQISYDITDMFWVGKLGSGEVAAVGTAGFYINKRDNHRYYGIGITQYRG